MKFVILKMLDVIQYLICENICMFKVRILKFYSV